MSNLVSYFRIFLGAMAGFGGGILWAAIFKNLQSWPMPTKELIQSAVFLVINVAFIGWMVRTFRQVVRERRDPTVEPEQAGVRIGWTGVEYRVTSFTRIGVIIGCYVLGVLIGFTE